MVHKLLTGCTVCIPGVFWLVRDLHSIQGDKRRDCGSLFFDLMPQSLCSPLLQNCLCTRTGQGKGTRGDLNIPLGADEGSGEVGLRLRAKLHLSWCVYASAAGSHLSSRLWGGLSHAAAREVKEEYCYKWVFEIALKKSLARVSAKPRFNIKRQHDKVKVRPSLWSQCSLEKERGWRVHAHKHLCSGMGDVSLAAGCSWYDLDTGTSTVIWTKHCLVSLQRVWWVWVYDCTWLWNRGLETPGQNPSPRDKVQQTAESGNSGEAPPWQMEEPWRAEPLCRAEEPDPQWHSGGAPAARVAVDGQPALQPRAWTLPTPLGAEQEHRAPCLPADWAWPAPHTHQQQAFLFSHLPAHPQAPEGVTGILLAQSRHWILPGIEQVRSQLCCFFMRWHWKGLDTSCDPNSPRLLPLYSSVLALGIYLQNSAFSVFFHPVLLLGSGKQQDALVWHLCGYRIGRNSNRRKSETVPE